MIIHSVLAEFCIDWILFPVILVTLGGLYTSKIDKTTDFVGTFLRVVTKCGNCYAILHLRALVEGYRTIIPKGSAKKTEEFQNIQRFAPRAMKLKLNRFHVKVTQKDFLHDYEVAARCTDGKSDTELMERCSDPEKWGEFIDIYIFITILMIKANNDNLHWRDYKHTNDFTDKIDFNKATSTLKSSGAPFLTTIATACKLGKIFVMGDSKCTENQRKMFSKERDRIFHKMMRDDTMKQAYEANPHADLRLALFAEHNATQSTLNFLTNEIAELKQQNMFMMREAERRRTQESKTNPFSGLSLNPSPPYNPSLVPSRASQLSDRSRGLGAPPSYQPIRSTFSQPPTQQVGFNQQQSRLCANARSTNQTQFGANNESNQYGMTMANTYYGSGFGPPANPAYSGLPPHTPPFGLYRSSPYENHSSRYGGRNAQQ